MSLFHFFYGYRSSEKMVLGFVGTRRPRPYRGFSGTIHPALEYSKLRSIVTETLFNRQLTTILRDAVESADNSVHLTSDNPEYRIDSHGHLLQKAAQAGPV